VTDVPSLNGRTATIELVSLALPNGSPVTGYSQRTRLVGGAFGGWYGFGNPSPGVPVQVNFTCPDQIDGTEQSYEVQVRATNAIGNGSSTATKPVTCTIIVELQDAPSDPPAAALGLRTGDTGSGTGPVPDAAPVPVPVSNKHRRGKHR
jgi:hypothetical protein